LENRTALELPFEGQRRVALLAEIQGQGAGGTWRLGLCNVHLDNRSGGSRFFASFGTGRLRQTQFLLEHLPTGSLVLAGDFNTWMVSSLERTLAVLRRSFLQPPVEDRRPTYSRKVFPDRHVDHLYFRANVAIPPLVRRIENRFGSDHHPVVAWVSLADLGTPPDYSSP
jgi:endonuclease/exonuclease/phosphatase family metal-dependent hydrolase